MSTEYWYVLFNLFNCAGVITLVIWLSFLWLHPSSPLLLVSSHGSAETNLASDWSKSTDSSISTFKSDMVKLWRLWPYPSQLVRRVIRSGRWLPTTWLRRFRGSRTWPQRVWTKRKMSHIQPSFWLDKFSAYRNLQPSKSIFYFKLVLMPGILPSVVFYKVEIENHLG